MDEFEIIRRYFASRYPQRADVVLGVGDDGALTRLDADQQLVSATDSLVAGTHFSGELPADAIAHRSLAANLSDLAAMGAEPRWFLLALSLPEADAGWLQAFSRGLIALAEHHRVALIGGDTVRGPLAVTVTALGSVPAGHALRRDGANPGDAIYVSGSCGDAAWAWRALAGGQALPEDDPLYRRFAYPEPRVAEGCALRDLASAAIDISDGLHVDLERLLAASGAGAVCRADDLPLSSALLDRGGEESARYLALAGGDDYELCFTVPSARESQLLDLVAGWDCSVSRLGEVVTGRGLQWRLRGEPMSSPRPAFAHF